MKISKGALKNLITEEVKKLQNEEMEFSPQKKYDIDNEIYLTKSMDYIGIHNGDSQVNISTTSIQDLVKGLIKLYRGEYTNLNQF